MPKDHILSRQKPVTSPMLQMIWIHKMKICCNLLLICGWRQREQQRYELSLPFFKPCINWDVYFSVLCKCLKSPFRLVPTMLGCLYLPLFGSIHFHSRRWKGSFLLWIFHFFCHELVIDSTLWEFGALAFDKYSARCGPAVTIDESGLLTLVLFHWSF